MIEPDSEGFRALFEAVQKAKEQYIREHRPSGHVTFNICIQQLESFGYTKELYNLMVHHGGRKTTKFLGSHGIYELIGQVWEKKYVRVEFDCDVPPESMDVASDQQDPEYLAVVRDNNIMDQDYLAEDGNEEVRVGVTMSLSSSHERVDEATNMMIIGDETRSSNNVEVDAHRHNVERVEEMHADDREEVDPDTPVERDEEMHDEVHHEESMRPHASFKAKQAIWTELWEDQCCYTSPNNTKLAFVSYDKLMEVLETEEEGNTDMDEDIKNQHFVNLCQAGKWMRGNFGDDCLRQKSNVARQIRKKSAIIVSVTVEPEVEETDEAEEGIVVPSAKHYVYVPMNAVLDAVNLDYLCRSSQLENWVSFRRQIQTRQIVEVFPEVSLPALQESTSTGAIYSISRSLRNNKNVVSFLSKKGPLKDGQELPIDDLKPADKLIIDQAWALARLYSICPLSSVTDVYTAFKNALHDQTQLVKCYTFDDMKSVRFYKHGYPPLGIRKRLIENLQNSFPSIPTEGKVNTFTDFLNIQSSQGLNSLKNILQSSDENIFNVFIQPSAPCSLGREISREERQLNKRTVLLLYNSMRALHVYFFCCQVNPKSTFKVFSSLAASQFTVALSHFSSDKIVEKRQEIQDTTLVTPLNEIHYNFTDVHNPPYTSIIIFSNKGNIVRRIEFPNMLSSFTSHQQILFKLLFHLASPGYAIKIPQNVILHPIADFNNMSGTPQYNKYACTAIEQFDLGECISPVPENNDAATFFSTAGNMWQSFRNLLSSVVTTKKQRVK